MLTSDWGWFDRALAIKEETKHRASDNLDRECHDRETLSFANTAGFLG